MPLNHNATKCYIMLNKIDAEEFVKINSKLLLLLLFRPLFLCLFCVTNLLPIKAKQVPQQQKMMFQNLGCLEIFI